MDADGARLLDAYLEAAFTAESIDDERYVRALAGVRDRADEVVTVISEAFDAIASADTIDYPLRWALVDAAAAMRVPAALPLLARVIETPMPLYEPQPDHAEDEAAPEHATGTALLAPETVLRTTAVDGVGLLALDGSQEAIDLLRTTLQIESLSIRRAAVQALLAVDGSGEMRDRLRSLLPDEQQFLVDLQLVTPADVPGIADPEQDLATEGPQPENGPPPFLDSGSEF